MFSAYHVEQERWTLQQLQCDCGSNWTEIGPQQLMHLDGRPSDVYRPLKKVDRSSFLAD